MQDRVPTYPGRVTLTPVAGQANTYDMARADQPTQEGTPLNKSTLLKDATAALFGFGVDALPDDMFNALAHTGDLHVWKRTQNGHVDYPVSPNRNAYQEGTSGTTTIEYMGQLGNKARIETGSYVGTGTYGSGNLNMISFPEGFVPKLVLIQVISSTSDTGLLILPVRDDNSETLVPSFYANTSNGTISSVITSFNHQNNRIGWYASIGGPDAQMNISGFTYKWVAIS